MSTKTRVWQSTSRFDRDARVEEYRYSDGTLHYSFRDRLGRPNNLKDFSEAQKIIKTFNMEPVK